MKRNTAVILIIALILSSNIFAQQAANQIDDLLNKYYEYNLFNGTVLAAKDGKVIYTKGFGFANYEFNVPLKPNTKFRIGSISKQFTATLIMLLVDEGKINLDSSITTYLKDYRKNTGDKVTIRHLLTHTSGIKSYTDIPNVWSDSLRNHYTKEYFIKHFHSNDLQFEPGTQFAYNNTGYYLLAAIAEEVTGKKFEDLIREKIIEPANLTETGIEGADELAIKGMAQGYIKRGPSFYKDPYIYMPNAMGAGSMYSTVEDMYKWDRALRNNLVLKKELKEQMLTPFKMNYGFGWFIVKSVDDATGDSITIINHSGGINGFNTLVTSILEDGRYVAIFNNTGGAPLAEITNKILKILNGQEVQYPKKPIKDYLWEVIEDEGIETALENYKALKEESADLFDFSESQLNSLGYLLLNKERFNEAKEIFRLNIQEFPKSSNVYDSMGEAFYKTGDFDSAIVYYKKSLKLNPANDNAKQMLEKMGAEVETAKVVIDAQTLSQYCGVYELTPQFKITVRADGSRLFAQATAQPEFEIFPMSKNKFYYKIVNAQIEFVKNDKGEVVKLILYQAGRVLPAKKIAQ